MTVASAAAAVGALPTNPAQASTFTYHQAARHGVSAPQGKSAAAHSSSTSGTASTRERGSRLSPHFASRSSAAQVAGTSASAASAHATLLHNFNGVSSLDSQLTNYNAKFEPPDTAICAGNGFVLAPVNSAYRIYHTNGSQIEGPFNINDLFNEGGQEFTSDPRCHYDAATHTWFATILFINAPFTASHLDIAVNTTGDPTNLWTEYKIDTTNLTGNGCPCFGDQPRIGIDQYNLYVSSDEFSIQGPQFNGGQIFAFAKSDLIAASPVHFAEFNDLGQAGNPVFSIEPAISNGSPNAEYFLNALDPNATFDNRLGVWALTNRQVVATGGTPTLSDTIIGSEVYGVPVRAPQQGATSTLNPGDDRMQQAQYISGNLWGELTTSLTIAGDSAQRDGAAWFKVHPTLSGDHIGAVTMAAQGYVAKAGTYLIYPALQVDTAGRGAMVFTETSPSLFPSAAYAVIGAGSNSFSGPIIAAHGSGPYDANATRWGDYSYAEWDSATDRFWLAAEYIPPPSSWTTTGRRNWGTRILEVAVS